MYSFVFCATIGLFFFLSSLWIIKFRWLKAQYSYPPGPKATSWLAGNLSDVPKEYPWLRYSEWAKRFGDLVYFTLFNNPHIVVNSLEVANDLFHRRSNIYSSRNVLPMIKMMGFDWVLSRMEYGDKWRSQRRVFLNHFKPEKAKKYRDIQIQKINDMLFQLKDQPDDFLNHIRRSAGAIIMSATFDYEVLPQDDEFVKVAESALVVLTSGSAPGKHLVNSLPWLRFLPSWLPGGSFKLAAENGRTLAHKMLNSQISGMKERMKTGAAKPCVASELIDESKTEQEMEEIKAVCGSAFIGGADTSVSVVATFFYAMVNFPSVQRKAQEEIDQIIGNDRLPGFDDRPSLPYVEALYREVLRWHPVFPAGVPHYSTEADYYKGYYIPKGTMVIPNIWAMTRDPNRYEDAELFNPSRFFDKDGKLNDDDVGYAFGFGRRICPGQQFGSSTIWLSIVCVLATLDIHKKKDDSGREVPADSGFSGSVLSHPLPFKCDIIPRSKEAERLIEASFERG